MILIGLGANLPHPEYGAPEATLTRALQVLEDRGIGCQALSRWYVSPPWPPTLASQPWYVNAVAALETGLSPAALLTTMHEVEWSFGRVRMERWAPRRIDLDLLAYHDRVCDGTGAHGDPVLPHPRMDRRAFVLMPLRDVAPDWRHPRTGTGLEEMLASTGDQGVQVMPEVWHGTPDRDVAEKALAGAASPR